MQICGCHEIDTVSINTVNLDLVIPFYQPPNTQPNFKHNSTSRKSFSRGNQKFRLSLGGSKPAKVEEELEDNKSQTYDEFSSPNLSLEVVNEGGLEPIEMSPMPSIHALPQSMIGSHMEATYNAGKFARVPDNIPYNLDSNYSYGMDVGSAGRLVNLNGPTSLYIPADYNICSFEKSDSHHNVHDVEYNPNDSNPPILTNYDNYEMAEDFPVNQNLNNLTNNYKAVPPATAAINASSKSIRKTTTNLHKRSTAISSSTKQTSTAIFANNKLGQTSSVSSMELHKLDDNMVLKKSSSSNVVNKNKRYMGSQSQFCKENTQQKNINVEIITKPPMRSRTTLDMRTTQQAKQQQEKQTHVSRLYICSYSYSIILISIFSQQTMNYRPDLIPTPGKNMNRNFMNDDHYEFDILSRSHEEVLQELSNRQASLDLLRNSTR